MDERDDVREAVAEEADERGVEVDRAKLAAFHQRMLAEQSLPRALLAGIIAGVGAAFVWGLVTKLTNMEIGWLAIGVGFVVGLAVRIFGRGVTPPYQVIGAVLAGLAVAFGKIVAIAMLVSEEYDVGAWEFFSTLSVGDMVDLLRETFHGMDVLFYAIALWAGWSYALRRVTQDGLARVLKSPA